jgi:N utilization substance protein A
VPEIVEGVVEIKAIAREPGHRTKIAVAANDTNVDPVGACVGARGSRVRMVVNELRGEKVDIVPYSPEPAEFVMKALSPAKVKEVRIVQETGTAEVVVPDYQLSVAIGKEGQNARLAARLTGWRVDIKSESQLYEEEQNQAAEEEEWAAGEWITDESGQMVWQPAEGGEAVSASDAGWGDVQTATEGAAEEKPDENISGDTPEPPGEPGEIVADAPTEVVAAAAEAPAQATVAEGEEGNG